MSLDVPQMRFGIMLSTITEAVKGSSPRQFLWGLLADQFMKGWQTLGLASNMVVIPGDRLVLWIKVQSITPR